MNKHEIAKEIFKDLYNYKIDENDAVCMKTVLQLGEIKELKEFAKNMGAKENYKNYARKFLYDRLRKYYGLCSLKDTHRTSIIRTVNGKTQIIRSKK